LATCGVCGSRLSASSIPTIGGSAKNGGTGSLSSPKTWRAR
jgi:hypothetical protein